MLNFSYFLITFLNLFLLSLNFIWVFFFKNNFYSVRINPNSKDILKNSKILKKINYNFIINWNLFTFLNFFIYLFFLKADLNTLWFSHFKLNNFCVDISIFLVFIFIFIFYVFTFYKNKNINFNIDYFISIFNVLIFVVMLYYTNNMYSFIFLLELNSLLVLYKFSVSNFWFKNLKKTKFNNTSSKNYINTIFFQYWANFFSSILIFFIIFNINFIFGSLEWVFLNYINRVNNYILYLNKNIIYFLISIFLIGFFLKIGFTPLHLFKLEVYKGLPFFSLFFYTSFYFVSFFLLFSLVFFFYFSSLKDVVYHIFICFVVFGGFYSLVLLFDVNLTKFFFAYSTIINLINFIILLMLI